MSSIRIAPSCYLDVSVYYDLTSNARNAKTPARYASRFCKTDAPRRRAGRCRCRRGIDEEGSTEGSMENRRAFGRGTHMGGQARRSLCRYRLGLGARQICLKIKLISRLGAGPSLSLSLFFFSRFDPAALLLSPVTCLSFSRSLPLSSSLSLSLHPLSVSRGHEQIEGTGPRWRRRRRWAGGPPCHRHGLGGEKRRWRSNKELWTSGCGHRRAVATNTPDGDVKLRVTYLCSLRATSVKINVITI